jgi:hypothetical protein
VLHTIRSQEVYRCITAIRHKVRLDVNEKAVWVEERLDPVLIEDDVWRVDRLEDGIDIALHWPKPCCQPLPQYALAKVLLKVHYSILFRATEYVLEQYFPDMFCNWYHSSYFMDCCLELVTHHICGTRIRTSIAIARSSTNKPDVASAVSRLTYSESV